MRDADRLALRAIAAGRALHARQLFMKSVIERSFARESSGLTAAERQVCAARAVGLRRAARMFEAQADADLAKLLAGCRAVE